MFIIGVDDFSIMVTDIQNNLLSYKPFNTIIVGCITSKKVYYVR